MIVKFIVLYASSFIKYVYIIFIVYYVGYGITYDNESGIIMMNAASVTVDRYPINRPIVFQLSRDCEEDNDIDNGCSNQKDRIRGSTTVQILQQPMVNS